MYLNRTLDFELLTNILRFGDNKKYFFHIRTKCKNFNYQCFSFKSSYHTFSKAKRFFRSV